MIVGLVALMEALFYLLAVPVHLAVRLDGLRTGAGLSIFERRAARRRADRKLKTASGGDIGPNPRRALQVLSRLRIDRAELTGRVALGDAAATALMCGALNGLARASGRRAGRLRVDVRPDFASEEVSVALSGMIRARTGQIILATLQVWIKEAIPWISTRLRT